MFPSVDEAVLQPLPSMTMAPLPAVDPAVVAEAEAVITDHRHSCLLPTDHLALAVANRHRLLAPTDLNITDVVDVRTPILAQTVAIAMAHDRAPPSTTGDHVLDTPVLTSVSF